MFRYLLVILPTLCFFTEIKSQPKHILAAMEYERSREMNAERGRQNADLLVSFAILFAQSYENQKGAERRNVLNKYFEREAESKAVEDQRSFLYYNWLYNEYERRNLQSNLDQLRLARLTEYLAGSTKNKFYVGGSAPKDFFEILSDSSFLLSRFYNIAIKAGSSNETEMELLKKQCELTISRAQKGLRDSIKIHESRITSSVLQKIDPINFIIDDLSRNYYDPIFSLAKLEISSRDKEYLPEGNQEQVIVVRPPIYFYLFFRNYHDNKSKIIFDYNKYVNDRYRGEAQLSNGASASSFMNGELILDLFYILNLKNRLIDEVRGDSNRELVLELPYEIVSEQMIQPMLDLFQCNRYARYNAFQNDALMAADGRIRRFENYELIKTVNITNIQEVPSIVYEVFN